MMDSLVRQLEWKTKILNRQPKVVIWVSKIVPFLPLSLVKEKSVM